MKHRPHKCRICRQWRIVDYDLVCWPCRVWVAVSREVWVDIDEAPRETMAIVFAQYREKIRAELCQIKNDLDHYNQYRNKDGKPIKFIFDFSEDIAEHLVMGGQVEPPIDKGIRLINRDSGR